MIPYTCLTCGFKATYWKVMSRHNCDLYLTPAIQPESDDAQKAIDHINSQLYIEPTPQASGGLESIKVDREWFKAQGFMQNDRDEFRTSVTFQDVAQKACDVQHSQDVAKFERERDGHIKLFTETRKLYENNMNRALEKTRYLEATIETIQGTLDMARNKSIKLQAALEKIGKYGRVVCGDCRAMHDIASQALADGRE